jgi:hypothetical protein
LAHTESHHWLWNSEWIIPLALLALQLVDSSISWNLAVSTIMWVNPQNKSPLISQHTLSALFQLGNWLNHQIRDSIKYFHCSS